MNSILQNAYLIRGLVNDIVLEIFLHFVAVDPDGPFTLLLVGTKWRDLVLSNSRLWTWVTVDDSQPNWRYRADICVALSRHLPIQLVLQMPFDGIEELIHSFPRCKAVFLVIPRLRQASSQGSGLVTYEEFSEGRSQYEEIYNLVADTLSFLEGTGIKAFVESPDDACFAHPAWTIFERMLGAGTLKDQQMCILIHLIKTLVFNGKPSQWRRPRIQLQNIWPYLQSFPCLTSLEISDNFVSGGDPSTLSITTLSSLRILSIECVTGWRVGAKGRIFDIFDLLSSLNAPAICNVSLYGSVSRLFAAVGNPNDGVRPSQLNLSFMSTVYGGLPLTLDKVPIFCRLQQLTMDFSEPYRSSIAWPILTVHNSFQNLKSLLPFMPENCILSLHGGEHLYSMVQWDMPKVKALDLVYSGNHHNQLPCPVPPRLRTFKLKEGSLYGSHYTPWIRFAPNVVIENMDLRLLLGRIFPLPLMVEVLDTCTSTLESHNAYFLCSICSSFSGYQGCFPHLTMLRSTVEVAKAFIEHFDLQNLHEITLCMDKSRSIGPFDSFVSAMAKRNHFPTRLQILGVEVFPPWSPLLRLISIIGRKCGEELITVKLPGLPHPSILRPLLDALKNKMENMMEANYDDNKSGEDSREPSCSACLGSGWRCYKGMECDRFPLGTMVSITKETYIGEYAM